MRPLALLASGALLVACAAPVSRPSVARRTARAQVAGAEPAAEPSAEAPDPWARVERRVGRARCEEGGLPNPVEAELTCESVHTERRHAGGAPLEAVAFDFTLDGPVWSALVVRGAGEQLVLELARGWASGVGGSSLEMVTRLEARDLVPGGEPEILASFEAAQGDSDMGTCDYRGREVSRVVLCSVDSGALRCVWLAASDVRVDRHSAPCEGSGEPAREERLGYERTLVFESGRLRVESQEGGAGDAPPALGTHALEALFERDDLRVPASYRALDM